MDRIKNFFKSRLLSNFLSAVHLILTVVFLGIVLYINVLPLKYFIPICFVTLLICAVAFLMAYGTKVKVVGKIISVIMIALTSAGIYYGYIASDTFEDFAGSNVKKDIVNIYVMKADPAEDLTSAANYTFGILSVLDRENTDKTIAEVEKKLGKKIKTIEYEGYIQLADALYSGEVKAVILNSAYISSLEENKGYTSFSELTRVLMRTTHETQLTVDNNIDVNKEPFIMYLSGIDIEGDVSTTSRSDVNILAVINPETRQVLLVNTPRDYWVPLSISYGINDKLTHAGMYGIDVSMDSLEMLYDTNIDYFFRINFTGFKELIDALGGIRVYSEHTFNSTHWGYPYVKGYNNLNGEEALAFVRERYAFIDGDNQRGRNQMAMIEGLVDKAASSALLENFSDFMESIKGSFETSMSSSQISSLVRMQLSEGGDWNVLTYAVTGENAKMPVYSMSTAVSVVIPDDETVFNAKSLISLVMDGKIINQDMIDELGEEGSTEVGMEE